jgi:hypothetical protein
MSEWGGGCFFMDILFELAGADNNIQNMIPLADCTIPTWGECSQVRTMKKKTKKKEGEDC